MAQEFIDLDVKAILVAWDCETATGIPPVSNDYVSKVVKHYPEAFLGAWAMIDPWKGSKAILEIERCINELNKTIIHQFYWWVPGCAKRVAWW